MANIPPRPLSAIDPLADSEPFSKPEPVPISALAIAAAAEPPPARIPSLPQLLLAQVPLNRLRPLAAHGALFLMSLAGGLAVATAGTITLHYVSRADDQLAAVRVTIKPPPPEPLELEIRKAKAELDAALKNGS